MIRFLSQLEHQGRLGPLVFDEIHKIITDNDYRNAFKNFHSLHKVKAVVFGLTGSLPPSLYPVLCDLTKMTWKVIRTRSSRKELKYQVVRVELDTDMDAAIVQHVHEAILTYRPEDRALVFCRSRNHVEVLSGLFKIHPYYAPGDNVTILEKNKETMVKWITGESRVMASTSILGCGFDYSHIRDVVHRDPSFSMLDQYQEDSRGGRDGMERRATTFIVDKKKYAIPSQQYDLGTQTLFDSLKETNRCRRWGPSLYLDGQAVQCITLPGASFCDICEEVAGSSLKIPLSTRPQVNVFSPARTTSPPKRAFDMFDPSPAPRLNLREHLRPLKRKRSSQDSNKTPVTCTSEPSPSKRVHFTIDSLATR